MISCILLSAGLSSRFGFPKALAKLKGTTVIGHLQEILVASVIEEVIIVLGDRSKEIKPHILNHKKVRSVYNKDYHLGQTSSFKAGLKEVSPKSRGIMLLPVDVPTIKTTTINRLADKFLKESPGILLPTYRGQRGHPPIFHAKFKEAILKLENTMGLNVFERQHDSEIVFFSVGDSGVIRSFNTPEEFKEIRGYLQP